VTEKFASSQDGPVSGQRLGARSRVLECLSKKGSKSPEPFLPTACDKLYERRLSTTREAPQLTGVLMVATEGGLRLIATDSYRLAFRDFAGRQSLNLVPGSRFPQRRSRRFNGWQQVADRRGPDDRVPHSDLDAVFDLADVPYHHTASPRSVP